MSETIIDTLTAQHTALTQCLIDIERYVTTMGDVSVHQIFERLIQFTKIANEHFALEEDVFYPQLLEKLHTTDQALNIRSTVKFEKTMHEVGEAVMRFLMAYSTEEKIEADFKKFAADLAALAASLQRRIQSEEALLYPLFPK